MKIEQLVRQIARHYDARTEDDRPVEFRALWRLEEGDDDPFIYDKWQMPADDNLITTHANPAQLVDKLSRSTQAMHVDALIVCMDAWGYPERIASALDHISANADQYPDLVPDFVRAFARYYRPATFEDRVNVTEVVVVFASGKAAMLHGTRGGELEWFAEDDQGDSLGGVQISALRQIIGAEVSE